jgi:hypothetical protein
MVEPENIQTYSVDHTIGVAEVAVRLIHYLPEVTAV